MGVTVNNGMAQEPGWWISKRYSHIEPPGQGLACCGLVILRPAEGQVVIVRGAAQPGRDLGVISM